MSSRQSEQAASRTTAAQKRGSEGETPTGGRENAERVQDTNTARRKRAAGAQSGGKRREISAAASARRHFDAFMENRWWLAAIESRIFCQPEDGRTKVTSQGEIQEMPECCERKRATFPLFDSQES